MSADEGQQHMTPRQPEGWGLLCQWADQFPSLQPVLDELVDDEDGEILPYLYMYGILLWMIPRHGQLEVRRMMEWLMEAYPGRNEYDQTLIALNFAGMMPYPDEPGASLRDLVRPELRVFMVSRRRRAKFPGLFRLLQPRRRS